MSSIVPYTMMSNENCFGVDTVLGMVVLSSVLSLALATLDKTEETIQETIQEPIPRKVRIIRPTKDPRKKLEEEILSILSNEVELTMKEILAFLSEETKKNLHLIGGKNTNSPINSVLYELKKKNTIKQVPSSTPAPMWALI